MKKQSTLEERRAKRQAQQARLKARQKKIIIIFSIFLVPFVTYMLIYDSSRDPFEENNKIVKMETVHKYVVDNYVITENYVEVKLIMTRGQNWRYGYFIFYDIQTHEAIETSSIGYNHNSFWHFETIAGKFHNVVPINNKDFSQKFIVFSQNKTSTLKYLDNESIEILNKLYSEDILRQGHDVYVPVSTNNSRIVFRTLVKYADEQSDTTYEMKEEANQKILNALVHMAKSNDK